jgi:hypothetical protein
VSTDGADNVTLRDFTADHSGDTLDGNSVANRSWQWVVDVRWSTNVVVEDVHVINPFTYSIGVADTTTFLVRSCSTRTETVGVYVELDGIHILNGSYGDVLSNEVDQGLGGASGDGDDGLVARTWGGDTHHVRYVGNNVRSGRHGAGMQFAYTEAGDQFYDIEVQKNTFWDSPSGIHTGIYGQAGSATDITIGGGPDLGNLFEDCPGPAVDFDGALSNIVVTHNTSCRSGAFEVEAGAGNVVADNSMVCPGGGPGAALTVSMSGTGAGLGDADTGQTEIISTPGWQRTSSGTGSTTGTSARSGWAWSGSAEFRFEVDVDTLPTYGKGLLLLAEYGSNEYFLEFRYNQYRIAKQTGGNYPWAGDQAFGTVTAGTRIGFSITQSGADLVFQCLQDGSPVGAAKTDTAPLAGSPSLMSVYSSSGSAVAISDLQVTDLA